MKFIQLKRMCFTVVRHKSAILRSRKNYRGITAKKLIIEYLSVFVKIRVYSVVYFPCKHEVKTPPSDWPVTRFFVVYISNQEGRLDSRESQIYYHFYKHGMTAEKLITEYFELVVKTRDSESSTQHPAEFPSSVYFVNCLFPMQTRSDDSNGRPVLSHSFLLYIF